MYAITVQENLIFVFAEERNLPTGRAKQSVGRFLIAFRNSSAFVIKSSNKINLTKNYPMSTNYGDVVTDSNNLPIPHF